MPVAGRDPPTPFARQGLLIAAIRSALLLGGGWTWRDADRAAREVVHEALKAIGAKRPTWKEASTPHFAQADAFTMYERTRCKRCGWKLPPERPSFCSSRCAGSIDEPGHPVAKLLRGDVNDWTSGAGLVADLVSDALMNDLGATAYVNCTGDGRIVEIVRYARSFLQVALDPSTAEPSFAFADRQLNRQDVLWLRSPLGRAPLSLAKEAIGVAAVLERHAAHLFSRGARPSGALMFPKGMGDDAVKRARAAWRAAHEGDEGTGRTAILYDGAEFKPFALSSVDGQLPPLRFPR